MGNIFGNKPAAVLAAIAAVLNIITAFPGFGLNAGQVGLLNAVIAAVFAVITAIKVRPFPIPLLVGVFNSAAALAVGFGWQPPARFVGLVDAAIVAVMAVVLHQQITAAASSAPATSAPAGR